MARRGEFPARNRLISRKKRPRISPPPRPMPILRASRRGYTARRCSEAGSALWVREGRKPSSKGSAENGLPPATRGKRRDIGPTLRFTAPNGAPGVPVRHTRGTGLADASASSAGRKAVRGEASPSGSPRRAAGCKNGDVPFRKPARTIPCPGPCREIEVAGRNRRTGRRKVSYQILSMRHHRRPVRCSFPKPRAKSAAWMRAHEDD